MSVKGQFKENLKRRFRGFLLTVTPLFQSYLIALAAFVFVVLPVAFVIINLKRLGWLWLPLFITYWLLLSVVYRLIILHREKREERFLYGDELYFQLYPRDWRREERKMQRKARREEKRALR